MAQLVFSRALLVQAVNSAAMIKACAESALLEDMRHEVSATAEILSTLKMLISGSRDTELTGLLVSAYETIGITHSQAKTVSLTATGLASTEFAAGSTVRELDRLRVDLRSVATRLGAPAEPAGPEADFDVLSDEEVQEQA